MIRIRSRIKERNASTTRDKGHAGDGGRARLKITCAWCDELLEDGPGPVSHGMCQGCRKVFVGTAEN